MTTQEFLFRLYKKISRFKFLIIISGLILGLAFFIITLNRPTVYTSFASVFPLTATSDNSLTSVGLSNLLGINLPSQSFSQEASINIVELAQSRSTRESVALTKLPQFDNKPIAVLLINEYNKYRWFWQKKIEIPTNDKALAAVGGELLFTAIEAKINKNGILELRFSAYNKNLLSPVSYALIDVISQFYKDLKIQKATVDYNFTVKKVDSLDNVLSRYDKKAVQMSNTTLFVNPGKLQYQLPKENLNSDKDRVMRQRDAAVSNREDALWRLQKVMPIVATLDKPEPPFEFKTPYKFLFGILGFILGCGLSAFILTAGLFTRYSKEQIKVAIFGVNTVNE